ncbi:MAG: hypothetical protein M0O96_00750 [Desulforhopalus sp.]|nr:hypothetical protein [Desulforhopalus sp.]
MTALTRKSTPEEELQILRSQLINEANKLLTLASKVLSTTTSPEKPEAAPEVNEAKFHEFRISALSWLSRVFGDDHITTSSFKNEVTHATASRTTRGVGIIEAAKQQLQGDWLTTTRGEITLSLITAFMRRAKAQLAEGNCRAAVIFCGGVIDELLRRMSMKEGISLVNDGLSGRAHSKKPLQLAGDLYKKKIYDRTANKQITLWIGLFNECIKDDTPAPEKTIAAKMLYEVEKILNDAQL